jgi:hypothetical protein
MRTHATSFAALLALVAAAPVRADEPVSPAYELVGPLYPGYASIPWAATYGPDGAWIAIVDGYLANRVSVRDAKDPSRVWTDTVTAQCASFRPAFTRDGSRLVLVEGRDLVVRRHEGAGWPVAKRIPLGVDPGVHADVRPISLSRVDAEAALCVDGRLCRVPLASDSPDARTAADTALPEVFAAAYPATGGLRVTQWGETVARTTAVGAPGDLPPPLPFAILAASRDDSTWLVCRSPKGRDRKQAPLDLVDARTRATLASFALGPDETWPLLFQAEFTPDGRDLVMLENLRTGVVRDARTGVVRQRLREYEGDRFLTFAQSPDGSTLLTAGRRAGEADVQEKAVLRWRRLPPR